MASFPEDSLDLVANGVLAHGIQMLRRAQTLVQESGVEKDNPHLEEIEESLRRMEAERRELRVSEEPPEVRQA